MSVFPCNKIIFYCKNEEFKNKWKEHIFWITGAKQIRNVFKTSDCLAIFIVFKSKFNFDIVERAVTNMKIDFKPYSDYQLGTCEITCETMNQWIDCTNEFEEERRVVNDRRTKAYQMKAMAKYREKLKRCETDVVKSKSKSTSKEKCTVKTMNDQQTQMNCLESLVKKHLDELHDILKI